MKNPVPQNLLAHGILVATIFVLVALFGIYPYPPKKHQPLPGTPVPAATLSAAHLHIPIFIYHSVRPDFPGETSWQKDFSITPELFDAQLTYLESHGYTPISMDEFERELVVGTTSPIQKPVVLTFDDGLENQYVYAFPLLQKHHMTATFFVYTNPISRSKHFMTWEEVMALDAAGMTIGDHTLSHPYLSKLSEVQLRKEVVDSRHILEAHLHKPVVHFASPFGYTSPALVALLKEAGYTTGRTTNPGMYHTQNDALHLDGYLVHDTLRDFIYALER